MCLDKGYDYDEVRATLAEFGFTAHIKARGDEAKELKAEAGKRARRWVVERSHSWMNRFRRILVRWDKKPDNYSPCCISPVPSSPFVRLGYSDSGKGLPIPWAKCSSVSSCRSILCTRRDAISTWRTSTVCSPL